MPKKKTKTIFKNPVFWLIVSAFLLEVFNIVITNSLGIAQQNTCPKSDFPGALSIYISIMSLILVLIIIFIAKNKIIGVALAFGWALILFFVGYLLQFAAVGGLDWCTFLGR